MKAWRSLLVAALVLSACNREYEGDQPDECADDADNDRDGLFDCLDPDCAGASNCLNVETDLPDPDPTPDPVDPTPTPADPTDTARPDTDVPDGRQPGPHPDEFQLATAWRQDVESINSVYGAGCLARSNPDWADVFAAPEYQASSSGEYFVYVFYRVQSSGTAAQGLRCPSGTYPLGCVDSDVTYILDGNTWNGTLPNQDIVVENPAGSCTITLVTTSNIEDNGETGRLEIGIDLVIPSNCPAELVANSSCEFYHEYDLSWVRAE